MTEAAGTVRRPRISGGHVLTILIGFFATVVAVDGFMIYQAVSTFGGIETDDAYRKGVAYNESLARDARQSLLGWKDDLEVLGAQHRLQVGLSGKDGPVAGRRVVAMLGRPATNRFDVSLELAETSPGVYEAALPEVGEGTWIVDISAYDSTKSGEPVYQARRRAWIGP